MFEDLSEFVQDSLILPIKGKTYEIPPVDAFTGAEIVRKWNLMQALSMGADLSASEVDELRSDEKDELDVYKRVLGPAFDEMIADNVSYRMIQQAGRTALALVVSGAEAAEKQWTTMSVAGQGKALTTDPTPPTSTPTETSSSGSTPETTSSESPESPGPES